MLGRDLTVRVARGTSVTEASLIAWRLEITAREGSSKEEVVLEEGLPGNFMLPAMEPSRLARSSASEVRMLLAWRAAARSSAEFWGAFFSAHVSEIIRLMYADLLGSGAGAEGAGGGSCDKVGLGIWSWGEESEDGREVVVVNDRGVGLRGWRGAWVLRRGDG